MKKNIWVALLAFVALAGCSKAKNECQFSEQNITAPAAEITAIQAYLSSQSITNAIQHSSGMFYTITAAGSGANPGLCSTTTVKYTGKLTNGTTFDSNTTGIQFQLGQLIVGWQKGVPLIQKGGKIKMYIPPTLGYGPNPVRDNLGNVLIPGSSILIFEVELLDVQ